MIPDNKVKFTIVGMGKLMEIIWPCLADSLGEKDLATRAIGTTLDQSDVPRKEKLFNIPIQLGNNFKALEKNQPDIIFFAPPPDKALKVINEDLAPYIETLKSHNKKIPEIYAFPPVPPGETYRKILGSNLKVVNIIPNNVSQIAGKNIQDMGYFVCSFAGDWSMESQQRLKRIFARQGEMVQVKNQEIPLMLGGACTFFSLWQVVPVLAQMLNQKESPLNHNQVANYLRFRINDLNNYKSIWPIGDDFSFFPLKTTNFLDHFAKAWLKGVDDYYQKINFPSKARKTIITTGFDLILATIQEEPRKILDHHSIGAATKGGVLEKALTVFPQLTKPLLEEACRKIDQVDDAWSEKLKEKVTQTAYAVSEHAFTLAN